MVVFDLKELLVCVWLREAALSHSEWRSASRSVFSDLWNKLQKREESTQGVREGFRAELVFCARSGQMEECSQVTWSLVKEWGLRCGVIWGGGLVKGPHWVQATVWDQFRESWTPLSFLFLLSCITQLLEWALIPWGMASTRCSAGAVPREGSVPLPPHPAAGALTCRFCPGALDTVDSRLLFLTRFQIFLAPGVIERHWSVHQTGFKFLLPQSWCCGTREISISV